MSEITGWIPSLVTTGSLGILIFLSKNLIITRLKNAVQHEYDKKLESVKSAHKVIENQLQTEILKREHEISLIRESAISGLAHRSSLLFERQLSAVEELWRSYTTLSQARFVSTMMSRVNLQEVSKTIAHDSSMQQFFQMIGKNVDMNKLSETQPANLRPFVSQTIWAYFSAYQSIVLHYVVLAKVFELGLGDNMTKSDELINLLLKVLPHQKEFIEKFGVEGSFYLLEEIEQKLLDEINDFLSGKGVSEERLKEATEIIKYSEQLRAQDKSQT